MENNKLQALTEKEKRLAENNHGLVYSFLRKYGYSIEDYYNIAVFGFLRGIQVYNRRKDLQKQYKLSVICYKYMRAEIGNYYRTQYAQKRKPTENILSLDADNPEMENLYNTVTGKSLESEYLEMELMEELLEKFTQIQRDIMKLKLEGYENKEVYLLLELPVSTFYKELNRIKSVLENFIA